MPATLPKTLGAALMLLALALTVTPARSLETPTADDTARFLAGLPPAPDSPLAALTTDQLWQQHARHFDSIFAREESDTLSKVRAFSRERLTDTHQTMLYMFSGPDFLYATSFFPNASTYVLAGLEPVGEIPQLNSLPRSVVDGTLRNLESSLDTLFSFSFFITKKMKTQLHEGPIYGALPILYVFLARTGKTINDVSFVSLDRDGNLQTPDGNAAASENITGRLAASRTRSTAQGVRVVFSEGNNGPNKTLYYFSTNLADGSVKQSGFLAFSTSLGPADSLIKSASYLMHTGGFNTVRAFLLANSETILQDDSGIPIAYFDPKTWRLQPFGRYVGPVALFGSEYQPQLGELFRKGNPIPLDFGIGYRWRRNESNLLLAEKVAARTSEEELAPPLPPDRYPQARDAPSPQKAHAAAGSQQTRRKQVEREWAGPLGCGFPGIFLFCSIFPAKSSH